MSEQTSGSPRRITILIAGLLALIGLAPFIVSQLMKRSDLESMVETLRSFGDHWWAPLALIAAYVVINLTGLPGTPFTLTAGAVWGWLEGGSWVMIATMIGTSVPYFVARQSSGPQEFLERKFSHAYGWIRKEGFIAVIMLRLLRLIPFAVISYAAGFARIRFRDYFFATLVGTLPGVFIYTYLADSILAGLVSPREAMIRIVIAGVLLASMVIGTRLAAKRLGHGATDDPAEEPASTES